MADREADDMNFFSTARAIEKQMREIVLQARNAFYKATIESKCSKRMIKRIASACYFHAYGIISIIWNL